MVNVIMRDGRVLKYNDVLFVAEENSSYFLRKKEGDPSFVTIIPVECVERIDGSKPCEVLYESRNKKRMVKY